MVAQARLTIYSPICPPQKWGAIGTRKGRGFYQRAPLTVTQGRVSGFALGDHVLKGPKAGLRALDENRHIARLVFVAAHLGVG